MGILLASILAFFMFPALGFWLGLLFLSIVYTYAEENDTHGFAIFATILGVLLFWKTIVLSFAFWQLFLIGVVGYVVIGGLWSVFRWFRYCREWIEAHPISELREHQLDTYEDGAKVRLTPEQYYRKNLNPGEHKSQLVAWVVYWPWSVLWNIFGDLINGVYDALVNIYQKTTDFVIRRAIRGYVQPLTVAKTNKKENRYE